MKKSIISVLLILVVVAGGAIYYGLNSLDSLVKKQLELHAGKALKTEVNVSAVKIKLLDGFGEISGFQVSNPAGFSKEKALKFSTVRLDIDTKNLRRMPIVIEEITIDSLAALFEVNDAGQGNFSELLKNVERSAPNKPSSDQPPDQPEQDSDLRIAINQITIKDTALAIDLTALGDKKYQEVLPTLHIENVGGAQGVPPAKLSTETAKVVLQKLIKETRKKHEEKLKDKAIEKIKEKAGESMKGLLEKLGS
jgi:hypothetical protein